MLLIVFVFVFFFSQNFYGLRFTPYQTIIQTSKRALSLILSRSRSLSICHTHTHRERHTHAELHTNVFVCTHIHTYIHTHANVPSSLFVNHSCKCLKFGNAKPKSLANFCIKAHITAKSGSFAQVCNVVVNASSSLSLHSSLHSAVAEDAAIFHASAEKMC